MPSANEYYVEHLSKISQANKVTFNEDVFNQKGVLVAKKGTEFSRRNAEIVIRHKLIKPIDSCISVENTLCKNLTLPYFSKRSDKFNLIDIMHSTEFFQDNTSPFRYLIRYPLIDQKLTVLSSRFPDSFYRTILCSVISSALSRELGLNEQKSKEVFIASMLSDVGLLHLPPELVGKAGSYKLNELKMMQGHVIIARRFADLLVDIPSSIGKAILEHHERPDGFGYPLGKTEKSLGIEGQVVAMADTISGLYCKFVVNGSCSWNAVAAIIHVPTSAHSEVIRNAALRLLKKMKMPVKNKYQVEQFPPLVQSLKNQHKQLNEWLTFFSQILEIHKKELAETDAFRPYTLLNQLNHTIATSGLLLDEQLDWLEGISLPPSDTDRNDIEEYELKLGEIEYQCLFVMGKLREDHQEWARRFESRELALHYYTELKGIFSTADGNSEDTVA